MAQKKRPKRRSIFKRAKAYVRKKRMVKRAKPQKRKMSFGKSSYPKSNYRKKSYSGYRRKSFLQKNFLVIALLGAGAYFFRDKLGGLITSIKSKV